MAELAGAPGLDAIASGRPRRVAVISLHTSPTASLGRRANGGLNVYVREVCSGFSRRGVATDVFTRCVGVDCPTTERVAELSQVVYLPAGPIDLDKYRLLEEVPSFTEQVADFIEGCGLRYDMLYSHYWLSGVAACTLRGRLRLPWAHTAHTLALVKNRTLAPGDRPEPEIRVDLEGEIATCADLLVTSTSAEADELRRAYRVCPSRLAVVPPGVDQETFQPQPRSRARCLIGHPDDRIFLFVGRLEPLKGVDVLLRALALLTAGGRYPEVRLLVVGENSGVGDGGELERLQRLAAELGLGDRVCFLGSVAQDRLPAYYAAAEACLMPSYSESFGLVGLEAQACGTPLVASDAAGLASVVRDGATGFLVDGPDPGAYAARMARLLDEPQLSERMGRRATRLAQRFSWDRTADDLLRRFGELVGAFASMPGAGLNSQD